VSAFIGNDVVIFKQNTVTIDMFGSAKYRSYNYGADDHVAVVHTEELSQRAAIFVASALNKAAHTGAFDYSRNFYAKDADALTIKLPVNQKGNPDYKAMDNYIGTIEAGRINALDKYLNDTGLNDYRLTNEESGAVSDFQNGGGITYLKFSYKSLFQNIVQGHRLKKDDHVLGTLPFVMSGVTNNGIADYIGNPVRVFPNNSLTVDIFGNVFYRNYEYGMGDDTGAFWNDDNHIDKYAMMFIASTMQKRMLGKFDYGNKLRSSQSLDFTVSLPAKSDGTPDYKEMSLFMRAVEKTILKDIVDWKTEKLATLSITA
jgi:hypothetical protein